MYKSWRREFKVIVFIFVRKSPYQLEKHRACKSPSQTQVLKTYIQTHFLAPYP
jgi:hypothetical protein